MCLKGTMHFHTSIYMDMVGEVCSMHKVPVDFCGFTRVKSEVQADSTRSVLILVFLV